MEHIIMTYCCHNSCYLPYVMSLAFLISAVLIIQQDSASAHRARETFNLLQRETPAFISPDLWSPNNPDHGPVDYQTWGISESRQKCTGCGRFEAASDWCLFATKRYLQYASTTHRRLHTCSQTIGGHFEYSLWLIKQWKFASFVNFVKIYR